MPSESELRSPPSPLVLLAAGLGTRFGGIKPLAKVGPNDESILAMTISQAQQAGFESVIVVVSKRTSQAIVETLDKESVLPFIAVHQDVVGPPRAKPWGTVAAILAAATVAQEFVVANGDDLYGVEALHEAQRRSNETNDGSDAVAILFRLQNTHRGNAGVSRAVAEINHDGRLQSLAEHRNVKPVAGADGQIDSYTSDLGVTIKRDSPTSMNLWVMRSNTLRALSKTFEDFVLETNIGEDNSGYSSEREIGLPQTINALNLANVIRVGTSIVDSETLGVTFAEDVEPVRNALATSTQGTR